MLSKNQIKLINSLQQKKYRNRNNLFIVEGVKGVHEFLNSNLLIHTLFCTNEFQHNLPSTKTCEITISELNKISNLSSPNKVLALFEVPPKKELKLTKSTLVLDGVNDPGNLGTIIRLCDWFGIEQLICSKDTVDCYNPKVVQSTMGSLTRVSIIYMDIETFISETELPVYSAMMDGTNIYKSELPKKAIIVMGNEANGVSSSVNKLISNKLTIPKFGDNQQTESLNVATATAIILSEFKRF